MTRPARIGHHKQKPKAPIMISSPPDLDTEFQSRCTHHSIVAHWPTPAPSSCMTRSGWSLGTALAVGCGSIRTALLLGPSGRPARSSTSVAARRLWTVAHCWPARISNDAQRTVQYELRSPASSEPGRALCALPPRNPPAVPPFFTGTMALRRRILSCRSSVTAV